MNGLVEINIAIHLVEIIGQRKHCQENADYVSWLDAVQTLRVSHYIEYAKKVMKTMAQHLNFYEHDVARHYENQNFYKYLGVMIILFNRINIA